MTKVRTCLAFVVVAVREHSVIRFALAAVRLGPQYVRSRRHALMSQHVLERGMSLAPVVRRSGVDNNLRADCVHLQAGAKFARGLFRVEQVLSKLDKAPDIAQVVAGIAFLRAVSDNGRQ